MVKIIQKYSEFVCNHPYLVLSLIIIVTIISQIGSGLIKTGDMNNRKMLPETYEVIKTYNIIEDEFGSTESAMIIVEILPNHIDSGEPRDIRDPEIINYINILSEYSEKIDNVQKANSISTIMKSLNKNNLPKSRKEIEELIDKYPMLEKYVSKDYTVAKIILNLNEDYEASVLVKEIKKMIENVPSPSGIIVQPAGEIVAQPIVREMIGPEMGKTSSISMIGVIIILIIMLGSVKFLVMPLATLVFGIIWAFGFIGFMGIEMTSATSGVLSMIIGIGIDFGIQNVVRYKYEISQQELKHNGMKNPREAMQNTMNAVMMPMFTTTLAALIGFKAMSMGELTFLAKMADMMSYGITACFLAAITAVPAIIIIFEEIGMKISKKLKITINRRNVKMEKIKLQNKSTLNKSKKSSNLKSRVMGIILVFIMAVGFITFLPEIHGASNYARVELTFLNQDPDPAEPGKYVELRWNVVKYGNNELKDLTFILEPEYPFFFDPSDTSQKTIKSWKFFSDDKEYFTLYYKLRVDEDAVEGTYKIKLWHKSESGNINKFEEYNIRVKDTKPAFSLGILKTSPVKLVADTKEAELNVELQNIGNGNAKNVVMTLNLPEGIKPTYGYSNRANLGTVAKDSSKTGTFYVDIDKTISPGEHTANITIEYKEDNSFKNNNKKVTIPLKIPVKNKPSFEIIGVKFEPALIYPGKSVELKINVKNTGHEEADSVSVRAFKESSQPFEFDEKSDFIGKLKPGEEGDALLKFTVDKNANPKKYILDLEIRYIYEDRVLTENEKVEIRIMPKEPIYKHTGFWFLILIGIIIIVFIGAYYLRKK